MLKMIAKHNQQRKLLQEFLSEEEGALTIVGLLIFVMMIMAGGIAVDLMRAEADRAKLQSVMDRAVLAAAALETQQEAKEIADNYLAAAGLEPGMIEVNNIDAGDGRRQITFEAAAETESIFIDMFGQDELIQPMSTSAVQEYSELEVALVLDISGSMRHSGKIQSLRTEASKFVTDLLDGREDLTTVSVIPYNGKVNLGAFAASYLPLTSEHNFSHCVTFPPEAFERTGLNPSERIQRMPHFDRITGDHSSDDDDKPGLVANPHCKPTQSIDTSYNSGDTSAIIWSNNVTDLTTAINNFQPGGWTATDLGAKVGALMLDPSMQPYLTQMIADGHVDTAFAGRPANWDRPSMNKVLIIMTDGDNTNQYNLDADKMSGPSGVFVYREGLTLVPDDVATVNEQGQSIVTCDSTLASQSKADDNITDLELLAHNNCGGTAGRWTSSWEVNPDDSSTDPSDWWRHPRVNDLIKYVNSGNTVNPISGASDSTVHFSVYSRDNNQPGFFSDSNPAGSKYQPEPYGGTDAYELSYQELFALYSLDHIDDDLFGNANEKTRKHYRNADRRTHSANQNPPQADTSLVDLCEAATTDGRIEVFTIAFNVGVGSRAERVMSDCAAKGDPSNFIRADDPNNGLGQAFSDILAAIENLRLTAPAPFR